MATFGLTSGTITKRGMAEISGIVGAVDVIIYPAIQSVKLSQSFEKEVIKNQLGFDVSASAKNEHATLDISMKLLGDTAANAKAGSALQRPLAVVTLSGFDVADYNGKYTIEPGSDSDLGNTKVGDMVFKLLRYQDADQQTLMTSTPV